MSVVEQLSENPLCVKAKKCEFHVTTNPLLGFIFEAGSIRPDPAKIEAVSQWEPPNASKKLQQFLGFADFYRRFIRNYSSIAAPLTQLTSTNPEAQRAFDTLKNLFVSALSSFSLMLTNSSSWRWTPPNPVWEPFPH